MLNVKFQFGQTSTDLKIVNVGNVTPEYMTFERSVSDDGIVAYQPAYDVPKIMELWREQECPTYLDIADLKNNRWGEEDDTLEEVF